MLQIGVQTKNAVDDTNPMKGYTMLKKAGFSCVDFSLNSYVSDNDICQPDGDKFFDQSLCELEQFFMPHKQGAKASGIAIHQMHMPYPIYIPSRKKALNDYLMNEAAPKSMKICAFLECQYIVIHGFKLARFLGSEVEEWKQTELFLDTIAPMAKEMGITICSENLYDSIGGHLIEGPCCDARKVVERIDRINNRYHAEVLGFCFDTGHANLLGLDFESFITTLNHRLKILHIHDNDGVRDLHQIPFTFTRTRENQPSTDWDGFIRGMRNIKFNKVLSFETAPVMTSFPEALQEDMLGFIARIGEYFAEAISMPINV